ncbi:hypothetical protein JB92DRAFT_11079 [Gautieria morchelliformis]|nr:hypothetical protein JB92DRAFT_11079 [Gautieria morchelliformis]
MPSGTPGLPPPALALPDEILSHIFISCLPPLPSGSGLHIAFPALQPHPYAARRTLTQVCHRWRTVAINTPTLWTIFVLGRTLKCDHDTVKTWLSYTSGCPLDIIIRPREWSGSRSRVSTLLRLFRSETGRIRSLIAQRLHWEELLEFVPLGEVTQLLSMEVFCVRNFSLVMQDPDSQEMGLVYAPKLQYLELPEAHFITSFMTTSYLPLQSLILGSSDFPAPSSTYLQFLACCPELSLLVISNRAPILDDGPMWPERRLTLPALIDLEFSADYTPDIMLLLRSLHIPALTHLRFGQFLFDHHPAGYVLQVLWHFLTETAATLKFIVLNHHSLPLGENLTGPLLRNMSNLNTLVIHDVYLKLDVLECLIPGPDTPVGEWPCPQLRLMRLESVDIEGDALPRLIQARSLPDEAYVVSPPRSRSISIEKREQTDGDKGVDKVGGVDEYEDNRRTVDQAERRVMLRRMVDAVGWGYGSLRTVAIYHCCILSEETMAALVEIERTYSDVVSIRR